MLIYIYTSIDTNKERHIGMNICYLWCWVNYRFFCLSIFSGNLNIAEYFENNYK